MTNQPFAETQVYTVRPHLGGPERTVNRADLLLAKGLFNQPDPTTCVVQDRPNYLHFESDSEEEEWYCQSAPTPLGVAPVQPPAPNPPPLVPPLPAAPLMVPHLTHHRNRSLIPTRRQTTPSAPTPANDTLQDPCAKNCHAKLQANIQTQGMNPGV